MKNRINFAEVIGVTDNSRKAENGFIFVAIKGLAQDGHKYIKSAIDNGAKIIVHQDEVEKEAGITYIQVEDCRLALSEIASIIYPKQPAYIMGVTGTNGKTSTVHFIREILHALGKKAVSIGTMGVLGDIEMASTGLNTLPADQLHPILQQIAQNDIDYVAMECSSHGIDQHRIEQVKFTACGFTNFTQDHLDYHHTMENYLEAKEKLFSLMKDGYAVLNTDIPEFDRLYRYCKKQQHKIICYGKKYFENTEHNITILAIETISTSQKVTWQIDKHNYQTQANLVGEFQIYNLACAIGLLMSCNIEVDKIMAVLPALASVTGRMELVAVKNQANVFIDYAHTPDALEHALQTLRKVTVNNLWVIFGCGGDRDQGKRPIMGKIACQYADKIIVTDDNPRSEDPAQIRQEIIAGYAYKQIKEIAGREEAIAFALSNLKPGDNLLVAGKGHENYQIIGKETIEFSDKNKVLDLLR